MHSYNEITYKDVYEGIDVKYYTSSGGALENDIIVKPGVNAGQIKIQIDGIERLPRRIIVTGFGLCTGQLAFPHIFLHLLMQSVRKFSKSPHIGK